MTAAEHTARSEAAEWERREAALLAFVSDELQQHWRVLGISLPPSSSSSSSSSLAGVDGNDHSGSGDDDHESDSMSSASMLNRRRPHQSLQPSHSSQSQLPLLTTDAARIGALAVHVKRLSAALTAARVREEFNITQV
jgi:hypothetical protein